MTGWTVAKYEWCCHNEQVGCLNEADLEAKFQLAGVGERARVGRSWSGAAVAAGAAALVMASVVQRICGRRRPYSLVEPLNPTRSYERDATDVPLCGTALQ
jgi:hypothetical protein